MMEFADWLSSSWGKLKEELLIEDLTIPSEVEGMKGLTAIWLLARASVLRPAQFLKVWDKSHESIQLKFLLEKAQSGQDKGKSALWFLAKAAKSDSKLFLKVWQKFKDYLKLSSFLDEALEHTQKGQSVLWNLACTDFGSSTCETEFFLTVWEKYQDEIKLSHLLNQAQSGGWNGVNILCFLAMGAGNNKGKAFEKVWHKLKTQITIDHLLDHVQGVNCRNVCALMSLEKAPNLFQDVLAQVPGIIPIVYLKRYQDLAIPRIGRPITQVQMYQRTVTLLEARYLFFITLEIMKSHGVSETSLSLVFEKAEAAQAAGYVNAFYDLGQYLASQNLFKEMATAYKKIPSTSYYYAEVNAELSEYYFGRVLNVNFSLETWNISWRHYLARALSFALQSGETKNELIQKIAYIYIYQDKTIGAQTPNVVPEALLKSIPDKASVHLYFKLFDQVKAMLSKPTSPLIFSASQEVDKLKQMPPPSVEELHPTKMRRLAD